MMNNAVLYCSKEHHVFLYESKEVAKQMSANWSGDSAKLCKYGKAQAEISAKHFSNVSKTNVLYVSPGEVIFVAKREKRYWLVIVGEKIGWIKTTNWPIFLKELTNDV